MHFAARTKNRALTQRPVVHVLASGESDHHRCWGVLNRCHLVVSELAVSAAGATFFVLLGLSLFLQRLLRLFLLLLLTFVFAPSITHGIISLTEIFPGNSSTQDTASLPAGPLTNIAVAGCNALPALRELSLTSGCHRELCGQSAKQISGAGTMG